MNDISRWAQALLEFENLRFVVIDTTSIKKDADIIRFVAMDQHGFVDESLFIDSRRYPGQLNTEWTGITPTDMMDEGLSDLWYDVQTALKGNFVLAYGLDFIQERLDENAAHYGLKPVQLIGDCLMQTSVQYFKQTGFTGYNIKLVDACARIGHILPDKPNAEQRARGQLMLLKAMASSWVNRSATTGPIDEMLGAPIDEDEDLGDLDDHPF